MVTTYPTIRKPVTEDAREISQLDDLRTSWVAGYRQKHAEADCWAAGFGAVQHSLDTQERVFRMAEQLAGRGIDRLAVFATLRHADGVAQGSSGRSLFAAAAGCGVIDTLLGPHGVVVDLLSPEAFEEQLGRASDGWLPQPQGGRAMILLDGVPRLDHLRSMGFDLITFDGIDPAAFAWAIFELASRAEDAADQVTCDCHPSFKRVPLGVAVDGTSLSFMNRERLPMATLVPAHA
jgi:hypothetical protein